MPWVQVNFLGGQTWTHTQYPLNLVAIKIYIIVLGTASHVLFPPLFFRPNGWQHPCAALGRGVGMLIRKSSWGCSMPQFRLLTHSSSKNINPICLPSSILELTYGWPYSLMTNHLHWTTLNADARHFDSRLQKEQHDAAMPVMYFLYPLNLSSIVQVQVCQSWPATGQTWDTFQKSFPTMVFFPLGLRRMSPGPNIWLKGRTGRILCKSHAFNIIQLQLGSSDKVWFKVTRGDQNASLKVVQATIINYIRV